MVNYKTIYSKKIKKKILNSTHTHNVLEIESTYNYEIRLTLFFTYTIKCLHSYEEEKKKKKNLKIRFLLNRSLPPPKLNAINSYRLISYFILNIFIDREREL